MDFNIVTCRGRFETCPYIYFGYQPEGLWWYNVDNETIALLVKNNFPESITGSAVFRNELTLIVKKEYITEVAGFLKGNKELDFDFLSDLCGVDRVETDGVFEVVYHLYSIYKNHRVRLKVAVASNDPRISTVTGVWNTANWHERETYDMYGIKFDGHPI